MQNESSLARSVPASIPALSEQETFDLTPVSLWKEDYSGLKRLFDQWRADAASGRLTEAFACGTAAVVTPIGQVVEATGRFTIGSGGTGQLTQRMLDALSAIQRGRAADPHGWLERLD